MVNRKESEEGKRRQRIEERETRKLSQNDMKSTSFELNSTALGFGIWLRFCGTKNKSLSAENCLRIVDKNRRKRNAK